MWDMGVLKFSRVLVLSVAVAMLAGFLAPSAASAEEGSPTAIYSCYSPNLNATFTVTTIAGCDWGVITIYSTYDDKTHGKIQIINGEPYEGSMTFAQFVKYVLKSVTTSVANALWAAGKNFYNHNGGGPLPQSPPLPPAP
jgi:hypothetical protein